MRSPRSGDRNPLSTIETSMPSQVAPSSSSAATPYSVAEGKPTTDSYARGNGGIGATLDTSILEEDVVFKATVENLCEALRKRLQHGKPPLPALYELIYPDPADGESGSRVKKDASGYAEESLSSSSLNDGFNSAQRMFAASAARLDDETKLKFYALYKQATVGNINIAKPWLMDLVGRAKWEAWNKLKGTDLDDAKRMYINEYKRVKEMQGGQ
ncbi:unnamed protein product [Phytomonas sp. EM1]|nr:unnamed protein product [Phytomonas sp. EM1]|eukprot:CCW65291.1 unnamed protein product [Phytomonas sp. isolate EM1]